ncbi:MAG: DUF4097 domain-containing protein [Blastocatellia bacterium]|nr:DUF4097 domain-containing protein [Blastocatellia bacterium]
MTNRRMFIAVAVLFVSALSALAGAGPQRERIYDNRHVTETETRSFPTSGIPQVRLETFDGSVAVRTWDKSEVAITATKRARTQAGLRTIRLRLEQNGGEVSAVAEHDRPYDNDGRDWANVRFEAFVPRNANLRVTSGDGSLQVEGVAGEMELKTGDGSITVTGGQGRVRAGTGDGRIEITRFDGEAEAMTNDGRITLDGRFTALAVRTGDGSISLGLPEDFNATLETDSESITVQGLAVMEETDPSSRVRRWRIGSGGNLLTLKTGDGRITLRRAYQ